MCDGTLCWLSVLHKLILTNTLTACHHAVLTYTKHNSSISTEKKLWTSKPNQAENPFRTSRLKRFRLKKYCEIVIRLVILFLVTADRNPSNANEPYLILANPDRCILMANPLGERKVSKPSHPLGTGPNITYV